MLEARCPDFSVPTNGSTTVDALRVFVRYLYTGIAHPRGMVKDVVRQCSPRHLPIIETLSGNSCGNKKSNEMLQSDMANLLKSSSTADVTLLFTDAEPSAVPKRARRNGIRVHRRLLAARSKYFAGLFTGDLKTSELEVTEPVLDVLMRFAYCGFDEKWQADWDVWEAAGFYMFEDLQLHQVCLIAQKIDSDNLMTVLNKCAFGSPLQLFCIHKAIKEGRMMDGVDAEVVELCNGLKMRWTVGG